MFDLPDTEVIAGTDKKVSLFTNQHRSYTTCMSLDH